ncbi:dihydrolipoyl dehydrogenase [Paenibacillus alkalitolerans]|uniref:dihydrolipoyl dehydrogenase n=1 Tax=Paenibacillus alkalitolerans TaxID=2799335 RepID=UPI0018F57ABB|nr:dihydrolipoyl dehydrogenase [Paenibacillus alkalitolerans]
MRTYDVVVVGGGPGGYVAAAEAAKYGKTVALVEADRLGGTCLNRGCIPSKTLLRYAETIQLIEQAKSWGIETGEMMLDFAKMMERKDKVVRQLRSGVAALMKRGPVDVIHGFGTVRADKTVVVKQEDGEEAIRGGSVIVATGSAPVIPSIEGLKESGVLTSETVFDLTEVPKSILIVGGGIIGVEFACIFSNLGAEVTIVEAAERIVPSEDSDAANVLKKTLLKNGVKLLTSTKVVSFRREDGAMRAVLESANGERSEMKASHAVACIGRTPNVRAIEALNLRKNGPFVAVNARMETSIQGIYAAGDLVGGWQLAHAASAEGAVAAANACGCVRELDQRAVPRCIYTQPEIASVGIGEEEAKRRGFEVKTVVHCLSGTGKGMAMDIKQGFIKLIADVKYGEVVGVVMVGPHVTEMIAEASAFIHLEGTVEELASLIHPHPTLSESLMEAAQAWISDQN